MRLCSSHSLAAATKLTYQIAFDLLASVKYERKGFRYTATWALIGYLRFILSFCLFYLF